MLPPAPRCSKANPRIRATAQGEPAELRLGVGLRLEDLFDGHAEEARETEGERQARIVPAGLDPLTVWRDTPSRSARSACDQMGRQPYALVYAPEVKRLAHSSRLQAILDNARRQIREGAAISHEEFWREVEKKPGKRRSKRQTETS